MARKEIVDVPLSYDERFQQKLEDYKKNYNVESLNESNDRTLLHILIRTELMLEGLQSKVTEIMEGEDLLNQATELKKLSDLIRDATENVTKIQRTLAIDRKTRKTEETDSVAEFVRALKRNAKNFVDQRMTRVYCPDCKVSVFRFSPVHDHTSYRVEAECSQCGKIIRAHRKERDIWFDVKDAGWRKKYPAEIVQASGKGGFSSEDFTVGIQDDVIIEVPRISTEEEQNGSSTEA